VIQEFSLPDHGRIIYGNDWVTFETFEDLIKRFENKIYRLALQNVIFGSRRNIQFDDYYSNIHPLWQRRLNSTHHHSASKSKPKPNATWTVLSGSRYCQDLRDRVYGIMPLATHGHDLRVDYDLSPLNLLLESIWLEHSSDMDRTDVLMNLANILLLSPASICMYAEVATRHAKSLLWQSNLPQSRSATEKQHLRAASSRNRKLAWLDAANNGQEVSWRNFALDQRLKLPSSFPEFPSRRQCPWQMFVYMSTKQGHFGLKLAIDARGSRDRHGRFVLAAEGGEDREYRGADAMGKSEFMEVNAKRALALGVYRTTCAPVPLTVWYALAGGLESLARADNKAGAMGEVLEGFGKLDIDL
jgi:hypothetical protein